MTSKQIRTTCMRACTDSCGIIATVENGRVLRLDGDPEHGVTRGFLCPLGNNYLKRFYDSVRLLHPLRRGVDGWKPILWDEALDLVAEKLAYYRGQYDPRTVLVVNYSGLHGWLPRILGRLFWAHYGGATFIHGGLSLEPALAAQALDFGGDCTHEPEDLVNSAAFVLWGRNPAVTRQHCMPVLNKARKRGAPLVVIDPVCTATAQMADLFYQIRPGSDGMLAVGAAQLLLGHGAVDHTFIEAHSNGFEAYRQMVFSHSLDDVAAATDLSVGQIGEIADIYASRKPLATMIGLGPAYWVNGGAMVRLIDALVAISGNVGICGGGASTDINAVPPFVRSAVASAARPPVRRVLLPRLGDEILSAANPPIKMGWIQGANPAAACPDTNRVKAALRSLEFLVVVEQFMSATAELADLVLPCTTYLEMDDLHTAYGHNWLGITQPVVPPEGETKPDGEILQLLAERLGFGPALAGDAEVWLRRMLGPLAAEGLTLEDLRTHPRRNPLAVAVPFADRQFRTKSGKFEFIGQFSPAKTAEDSLHLLATKTLKVLNSQALPEDRPEEPVVRVHPATAVSLGLTDSQQVWVTSKVGEVKARLVADETVRRDVALLNPAVWKGDLSGVNQLRESALTDLGDGAAMHETLVMLRPARWCVCQSKS